MASSAFPDRLSVSGQLAPADFAVLAERDVRLVINDRPDGEAPGQMAASQGAELAARAGIAYRHIPVRLPTLSRAEIDAFAESVEAEPGRVHAHCASGLRSATLWALSRVLRGEATREEAAAWIASQGFDPSFGMAWLARNPSRDPE